MIDASKSIAACAEYYGDESHLVKKYLIEGEKKALWQRFPEEEPYKYQPFNDANKIFQWNENSRKDLKDYNLDDLSI
tara:strand:+ start:1726 stop:1956 length:231 start_codon:yes stop_codon:yes gene_type:complete